MIIIISDDTKPADIIKAAKLLLDTLGTTTPIDNTSDDLIMTDSEGTDPAELAKLVHGKTGFVTYDA